MAPKTNKKTTLQRKVWAGARGPSHSSNSATVGKSGPCSSDSVPALKMPKWNLFQNKPGKGWEEQVCHRDPPVLSIRNLQSSSASSASSRRRSPSAASASSRRPARSQAAHAFTAKMHARDIKVLSTKLKTPAGVTKVLKDQAQAIFKSCRYPPTAMTCEMRRLPSGGFPGGVIGEDGVKPPFKVPSNACDEAASQPPSFKKFPLRPEQLRSLGWMLDREANSGEFESEWRKFWVNPEKCTPSQKQDLKRMRYMDDTDYYFSGDSDSDSFDSLYGSRGDPFDSDSDSGYDSFDRYGPLRGYRRQGRGLGRQRRRKPATKMPAFTLDMRIKARYLVRGGVLADKIGYGKTAATIGLMDHRLHEPLPPVPSWDKGCFIPTKATLILVPGNLLEQWLGEISKFTGDGSPMKPLMEKGWIKKSSYDGAFNVFACTNVTPLKGVTVEELKKADVVICTYRLLFSTIYRHRLRSLSFGQSHFGYSLLMAGISAPESDRVCMDTQPPPDLRNGTLPMLREVTRKLLAGKASVPSPVDTSSRERYKNVRKADALKFPVLEMFYWKRIVFDEFHELEGFPPDQQTSLQFFRSHYRWGLTGTPPLDTVGGTIFMSSLFRVDITGFSPRNIDWEYDKLLTASANEFLDLTTRQNTAEIGDIKLEEHLMPIRHTARERALYLGQSREASSTCSLEDLDEDGFEEYKKLLKLCSHFQSGGGSKKVPSNADEECQRIFELKERRVVEARNRVARGLRAMALLESKLTELPKRESVWQRTVTRAAAELAATEDDHGKAAVKFFEEERAIVESLDIETLPAELDGYRPQEKELQQLLGQVPPKMGMKKAWKDLASKKLSKQALESLLAGQAEETGNSMREIRKTSASLEFFQQTLKVCQDNDSESRACTVCLSTNLPLSKLAITPCSHVFCLKCLNECVRRFQRCSLCNTKLLIKDVAPLALELSASQQPRSTSSASSSSHYEEPAPKKTPRQEYGKFGKYGTKLGAIVEKLHEIRRDDPTAKCIVFTQFDDLKLKVAEALQEFGVPMAKLQGSPAQRDKVIREWQNDKTAAQFVLLLSLEQSASGTNLTAGNHVVLVHPMLAATQEKAVSFEMQAIGRVRRHGQLKDTVHVWRFVTLDTIEEEITRQHQAELFERDAATPSNVSKKRKLDAGKAACAKKGRAHK